MIGKLVRIYALMAGAILIFGLAGCGRLQTESPPQANAANIEPPAIEEVPESAPEPSVGIPDLQAELKDGRHSASDSPIGAFDFLHHTYPLPRGWQNPDGSDATLDSGRLDPVAEIAPADANRAEKARVKAQPRIGLSHVATRFLDATGDGSDEAIVILKIETIGNAVPQVVYVYEWKSGKPELIWHFRTGDRADGGLKDIRVDNGLLTVELYGQDRFLLGETETGKITGDEVQLCCPTHFTRTSYKWNGRHFLLQGKRLTFQTGDPLAPPLENFGDIMNDPVKAKKYLDSRPKTVR